MTQAPSLPLVESVKAQTADDSGPGPLTRLGDAEWQNLCEKDDRTSPEGYPDMCLVTKGELGGAICEGYLLAKDEAADEITRLTSERDSLASQLAAMTERVGALDLQTLREANRTRQDEWTNNQDVDLVWRANELAGEVGEACNEVKKLARERRGWPGSRSTISRLAEEIADVVICADLLAMSEGIDLSTAVIAKFNATSEKVGMSTRLALLTPTAPEVPMGEGKAPLDVKSPSSAGEEP